MTVPCSQLAPTQLAPSEAWRDSVSWCSDMACSSATANSTRSIIEVHCRLGTTKEVRRSQHGLHFIARNLTISASHCILCSRTATCAREQITAARRVSLRRLGLNQFNTFKVTSCSPG
ncbi:hypothetical protein HaLaN_06981, partial [Haematococcus lacustris]